MQLRNKNLRAYMLALFLSFSFSSFAEQDALDSIHQDIIADYPQVEHINADEFTSMNSNDVVLFDVREKREFLVSHVAGAIQVDPNTSAEEFAERYAANLRGKTAVFYCSVGRRSSKLAARVDDVIAKSGATAAYNLEGGAFRWRNESRPLNSTKHDAFDEVTDKIHPYNWYWSRLVKDKKAIQYSPSE